MTILGVVLIVLGIALHIFIKMNMTQDERWELEQRRRRRQSVAGDLNRPISERELASSAGCLVFLFSPQGLLIVAGMILVLIGAR